VGDAIVAAVHAHWGLGSRLLSDIVLGSADAAEQDRFARLQRESTTADIAAALLRLVYRLDVRDHLALVRRPTTVIHRRGDRAVPYRFGREVAAAIPDARFIPLQGSSHFPWHGDVDPVIRACRQGLAASQSTSSDEAAADVVALSGREREILACVARGLGDREIAEQLGLSPHTVHRHVANIRGKLGSPSRTAAVAEAARRGLLS
jgi:DNA-binding CsgD family transcriptional regulator